MRGLAGGPRFCEWSRSVRRRQAAPCARGLRQSAGAAVTHSEAGSAVEGSISIRGGGLPSLGLWGRGWGASLIPQMRKGEKRVLPGTRSAGVRGARDQVALWAVSRPPDLHAAIHGHQEAAMNAPCGCNLS